MLKNLKNRIAVIGAGKVGLSIALNLSSKDLLDVLIDIKTFEDIEKYGISKSSYSDNIAIISAETKVIFVAVDENSIEEVSKRIASDLISKDCIIIHTSGVKNLKVLKPIEDVGCRIASAHPYQTFFKPDTRLLDSIAWGIVCADDDFLFISEIIALLGGKAILLNRYAVDNKALYHASAVVASNFTTMLLSLASELCDCAGIPANEFMKPIVLQTINNYFEYDTLALTGPIARADIFALKEHIKALEDYPELKNIYKHFLIGSINLAYKKQILNHDSFSNMITLLDEVERK